MMSNRDVIVSILSQRRDFLLEYDLLQGRHWIVLRDQLMQTRKSQKSYLMNSFSTTFVKIHSAASLLRLRGKVAGIRWWEEFIFIMPDNVLNTFEWSSSKDCFPPRKKKQISQYQKQWFAIISFVLVLAQTARLLFLKWIGHSHHLHNELVIKILSSCLARNSSIRKIQNEERFLIFSLKLLVRHENCS